MLPLCQLIWLASGVGLHINPYVFGKVADTKSSLNRKYMHRSLFQQRYSRPLWRLLCRAANRRYAKRKYARNNCHGADSRVSLTRLRRTKLIYQLRSRPMRKLLMRYSREFWQSMSFSVSTVPQLRPAGLYRQQLLQVRRVGRTDVKELELSFLEL